MGRQTDAVQMEILLTKLYKEGLGNVLLTRLTGTSAGTLWNWTHGHWARPAKRGEFCEDLEMVLTKMLNEVQDFRKEYGV